MWQAYLATLPPDERPQHAKVSASVAGDKRNADELLQLYLSGKKTAASSLLRDYHKSGDPVPAEGYYWIILDSKEDPKCIVRTVRVEMFPFENVPYRVAKAEGEGDGSIEFWRKSHGEFFQPYLKELGITDLNKEKVVTEFYDVVFTFKNLT